MASKPLASMISVNVHVEALLRTGRQVAVALTLGSQPAKDKAVCRTKDRIFCLWNLQRICSRCRITVCKGQIFGFMDCWPLGLSSTRGIRGCLIFPYVYGN